MSATQSSDRNNQTNSSTNSSLPPFPHEYPIVGPNDIMRNKQHGTSHTPVQEELRWKVSREKADNICNFNRHLAEPSGEWTTMILDDYRLPIASLTHHLSSLFLKIVYYRLGLEKPAVYQRFPSRPT
jgi:hypothetical protein